MDIIDRENITVYFEGYGSYNWVDSSQYVFIKPTTDYTSFSIEAKMIANDTGSIVISKAIFVPKKETYSPRKSYNFKMFNIYPNDYSRSLDRAITTNKISKNK